MRDLQVSSLEWEAQHSTALMLPYARSPGTDAGPRMQIRHVAGRSKSFTSLEQGGDSGTTAGIHWNLEPRTVKQ